MLPSTGLTSVAHPVKVDELVAAHFLDGLWSPSIDLTSHPVVFSEGVDAEFDRLAGDG